MLAHSDVSSLGCQGRFLTCDVMVPALGLLGESRGHGVVVVSEGWGQKLPVPEVDLLLSPVEGAAELDPEFHGTSPRFDVWRVRSRSVGGEAHQALEAAVDGS